METDEIGHHAEEQVARKIIYFDKEQQEKDKRRQYDPDCLDGFKNMAIIIKVAVTEYYWTWVNNTKDGIYQTNCEKQ